MNKKFANFFTGNYEMVADGKNVRGTICGYETSATTVIPFDNSVPPLQIHVSFYATDEQKRNIEAAIRNLALKFFQMRFTRFGLFLGFNGFTNGGVIKRLPADLEKIFAILEENGALKAEFCPVCGNPLSEDSTERDVDGFKIRIDKDCVETINAVISAENEDFKNAPNNYLKGFAGAFIGGLAGVAIAVGLYMAGFVSSLSAIVSITLGSFLYEKFHGKPNKMMIVIVTLTTFVMLAAAVPAIYIVAADIAAKENHLDISAIEAFKIVMHDPKVSRFFYMDLAMVILFTAIGAGFQIFYQLKKIKRQKNI